MTSLYGNELVSDAAMSQRTTPSCKSRILLTKRQEGMSMELTQSSSISFSLVISLGRYFNMAELRDSKYRTF